MVEECCRLAYRADTRQTLRGARVTWWMEAMVSGRACAVSYVLGASNHGVVEVLGRLRAVGRLRVAHEY